MLRTTGGRVGLFAAAVALAASAHAAGQAAAIDGMLVGPGGFCLDVAREARGAAIVLARCDGSARQRWRSVVGDYNTLHHQATQLCPSRETEHGTKLVLGDGCDWSFYDHQLRDAYSSTPVCLGVPGGAPFAAGMRVQLLPCDGSALQRWEYR
jgi:hypothetical protein